VTEISDQDRLDERTADATAAAEADRLEQSTAVTAVADRMPTPLPDRVLDTADPADAVDQSIEVPDDEDDYR